MIRFPEKPIPRDEIIRKLKDMCVNDLEPHSGTLFAHIYDTGDPQLLELGKHVFQMFMDKTMLNFTVYPSVLRIENELVSMVSNLLNGDEDVVGNFTYGGTESIFMAMKAARDYFMDTRGNRVPEAIIPLTGHPSFYKSAKFLGIRMRVAPVDPETYKVDVDKVNDMVTRDTAIIIGSAPNYPYGCVDDISSLGEIAVDNGVWLHVDACIGGFVLPFFKMLGENIPKFDFEVEGVTSISIDLHKYGYAPKGASLILYRNKMYRRYQIYVNASWPGYPLVNTTVLSTRSAGPLAASYAVINYLGIEGYLNLARKILDAKRSLMRGLSRLGFKILGIPHSSILSFTSNEINLFLLADIVKKRGWYVQLQPGSKHLGLPPSIHLTISPVHSVSTDRFLAELSNAIEEVRGMQEPPVEEIVRMFRVGEVSIEDLGKDIPNIMNVLGISSESISGDMALINMLLHELPPDVVEYLFNLIVNELFIYRG
jgi:glutamate/tyrosine decarboxylase-like PLP-dependent enzyme